MDDGSVERLAAKAGLEVHWTDAAGKPHKVTPDVLRTVLAALDYPAGSEHDIAESEHRLDCGQHGIPNLLTAWAGETISIGGELRKVPDTPGYHEVRVNGVDTVLAVAPLRCFGTGDISDARLAGLAVQLYALRGGHTRGFGDFAALADFAASAAVHGIDAIAISPAHALFPANPSHISPYSPSSRIFLNPLYADLALCDRTIPRPDRKKSLIDWPAAAAGKMADLRKAHEAFDPYKDEDFTAFCEQGGERLHRHCVFEVLDGHFRPQNIHSWRDWPLPYRDPASEEVFRFAIAHQNETAFRLFLQYLTLKSAKAAQKRASDAGMKIGIIADIATGIDAAGSDCWVSPDDVLNGLTIGAPPDPFNAAGQNWGITALSPTRMRQNGFASFVALLRASMGYAGGVRIDHAMGLMRLWVIPEAASSGDGVYLRYPLDDLLRLTLLESHRARAIVIGENLGTVPKGFNDTLAYRGLAGMEVLWFQQEDARFLPPRRWSRDSVALTTTHDLPTVAGWWNGRDIEWRAKAGIPTNMGGDSAERQERHVEKQKLWSGLVEAGCASPGPPPDDAAPVVDGAVQFIGSTPCALAILPVEDMCALEEQPNLPGTIDEHPNWRRRLPSGDLFSQPGVAERLARFRRARQS